MKIEREFLMAARWSSRKAAGLCVAVLLLSLSLGSEAQSAFPRILVSGPETGNSGFGSCLESAPLLLPEVRFSSVHPVVTQREEADMISSLSASAQVWLHITVTPDLPGAITDEKQLSDRVDDFLKDMPLSMPVVRGLVVDARADAKPSAQFVFALLRFVVASRSINPALRVAVVFPAGFPADNSDTVKRIAVYADLIGLTESPDWHQESAWIAAHALNKPLLLKLQVGTTGETLRAVVETAGSNVELLWPAESGKDNARRLCEESSLLTRTLTPELQRFEHGASGFSVAVNGSEDGNALWLGNVQSGLYVALVHAKKADNTAHIVTLRNKEKTQYDLQWLNAETGSHAEGGQFMREGNQWIASSHDAPDYLLAVLHRRSGDSGSVFNQVEVKGGIDLSVEEIIARWQQTRESERHRLLNYQSSALLSLHFESTSVTQAFDILMHLRQFSAQGMKTEFAQTELYINGVRFSKNHEFPLPQLEPEKVIAQPLELTLNDQYTYRLLGVEQIDGVQCYVVGIEPRNGNVNLYSGRVWIDGSSFREIRQMLSQRGLRSNIVVNAETEDFALFRDAQGNLFNLPRSLSAQQTLNAAGRDFLLQRSIQFSDYAINVRDFDHDVDMAHRGDYPMYRDTDVGLRQLKKKDGQRIVQETSQKRIVSLITGAMYGGTYNFPIPFAGISVADFDYHHTGAQLSTFFVGPVWATNLSKQFGTRFRLSGDLALNAIPGENRVFHGTVEDTSQGIWSWEQTLGGRAAWQATKHLSMTAYNYISWDVFMRTSETSAVYEQPRNGVNVVPGIQIRLTSKGYIFTANGMHGERLSWHPYGYVNSTKSVEREYTLYDGSLSKDYFIGKFTKGGWETSYFGGEQLDRFSRYFPSYFSSPRLHGIPSGTDSFDAIAMAQVHYGFNVMDFIKVEGLYSYARARNLDESSHFKRFDGVESNFNIGGPFGTLIQGTISYALDGNLSRYNSRWGYNMMIFKPF